MYLRFTHLQLLKTLTALGQMAPKSVSQKCIKQVDKNTSAKHISSNQLFMLWYMPLYGRND